MVTTYNSNDSDKALRIGQHIPERYLDRKIRDGIPAFKEMRPSELEEGLRNLENAINDGTIYDIIKRYEEKSRMKGYDGIIIAIKPEQSSL